MRKLVLQVAQAYPSDDGRGVARLDPESQVMIQAAPGDTIYIRAQRETVARIWSAEKADWNRGIVRLDRYTRQNAGVKIGETVEIWKADPKPANRITLAPPAESPIKLDASFAESIQAQLSSPAWALIKGDIIPIRIKHQFISQIVPLVVIETEPQGAVMVTEFTQIQLVESPVSTKLKTGVCYEDIGGLKRQLQRIRELIELPLSCPEVFSRLGIEPPKGVLLYGPPGTGKTLIAKAVANESGANFLYIAGPEIISRFYGESERKLREIFEQARAKSPSIIFIDELDSIAPKREEVRGEVEKRVVAQLLSLMDGLQERGQVIVIGATNRIDALDPALRRPGRFDREIELTPPERDGRLEILQIHTRGMPLGDDVNLEELADITHGFVGADLAALCREAAMNAIRRISMQFSQLKNLPPGILEQLKVTRQDFMNALSQVEPSALREVLTEIPKLSWDDIGGLEAAKQSLMEAVVWPLMDPGKFQRMGIKPPKGVLLYGPPGTGKTLLAKAVASQVRANFIYVGGAQFLSKWLGESERRLREIFRKAKQASPSIIFFDELDAIAPIRIPESESRAMERVVNQLLVEFDNLEQAPNVIVIGATNRPDIIDPALLRPGRFDRLIFVEPPDARGRLEILRIHTRGMPLGDDVNLEELADITHGFVGADLAALCREAAISALRNGADKVSMEDFMQALNQIKPSCSHEMLEHYRNIMEKFKSRYERELVGYR